MCDLNFLFILTGGILCGHFPIPYYADSPDSGSDHGGKHDWDQVLRHPQVGEAPGAQRVGGRGGAGLLQSVCLYGGIDHSGQLQ